MRSILVHLDHDDCSVRLDLARRLARDHGTRLVGLFAERARAATVGTVATWPSEAYRRAAAASRATFEAATAGLPGAEWRDADRGGDAEVTRAVIAAAHGVDLVVLGRDRGDHHHDSVPSGLAEKVILDSGRPCLVVPDAAHLPPHLGRRPLVAWNGSGASVRALTDALPLMAKAEEVVLLTIGAIDDRVEADCLRRFADHGLPVRAERLAPGDIAVMDLVLARAADNGADLLILGAHEPGGLPWLQRPNGTRHVLALAPLPLLMSN